MAVSADLESLLARVVEEHVLHGRLLRPEDLCGGRSDLVEPLNALIRDYLSVTRSLEGTMPVDNRTIPADRNAPLPQVQGFQTIERIGAGGMGEVFKLRDLRLDRIVAGKV